MRSASGPWGSTGFAAGDAVASPVPRASVTWTVSSPLALIRCAMTDRSKLMLSDGKAAPANTPAGGTDPRLENGPLAVVDVADGQVLAYCPGGLILDVPAKRIPALVDRTLREHGSVSRSCPARARTPTRSSYSPSRRWSATPSPSPSPRKSASPGGSRRATRSSSSWPARTGS